jgi:NTE family protein
LTADRSVEILAPVDVAGSSRSEAAERRLGVCLSGGGFRASFYGLGALRYLAEADLLRRVDVISSVSGGSIAAAMVTDRWDDFIANGGSVDAFRETIDRPFREGVTGRNLRNRWIGRAFVRSLLPFPPGRGVALGRTLSKNLYRHESIADLPDGPQVVFTSTDLSSGRAFRIARDFVGNFDYRYTEPAPRSIELGTAVAASAAFPMSLSVIWLPTPSLPQGDPPTTLSLHDGGVYDNLGLEWFQGWDNAVRPASARRADFLVVVNASGAAAHKKRIFGAVRALTRDLSIQYQQTLALRIRWLVDNWLQQPGRGVYTGITGDPRTFRYPPEAGEEHGKPIDPAFYAGALPTALVKPLASVRTDLDRFTEEEAQLLSYHGYWSLHARLAMYAPELAVETPAWFEEAYAHMPEPEVERVTKRLADGSKLLRRLLR